MLRLADNDLSQADSPVSHHLLIKCYDFLHNNLFYTNAMANFMTFCSMLRLGRIAFCLPLFLTATNFFKKTPVTGPVSHPNASAEVLRPESGEAGSRGLHHLNGGYLFSQEWTCYG